jgi:hypothetical protein
MKLGFEIAERSVKRFKAFKPAIGLPGRAVTD